MSKRLSFLIALLLLAFSVRAQHKETVTGECTYYAPSYMSLNEARLAAIEQAKINGLEKAFGTMVSQANLLMMEQENDRSNNSFFSLGECEVKGEWVGVPEAEIESEEIVDGQYIIKARVKGLAREVTFAKVNFETHLLRNGKGDEYETDEFKDGDSFYVSFSSPAKGYLAIYLLDADRNATRIVPRLDEDLFEVKRGERYLFVDDIKEHIILTTDRPQELDQVYIIFSPHKFYPPKEVAVDDNSSLDKYRTKEFDHVYRLPYVPFKDFQKWIRKLQLKDAEVQVATKYIKILGRE